jgi:hypothetical protein
MTLRGLEPVQDQIFIPAVEVLSGQSTVEQVHRQYKGVELICPHCLQEWIARLGSDDIAETLMRRRSIYSDEMLQNLRQAGDINGFWETVKEGIHAFPEALHVRFRRGTLDKANSVSKWMHFFHTSQRKSKGKNPPCYDPASVDHEVAIGSIKLALEKEYLLRPNIDIKQEKELLISIEQPILKRRPDLSVSENGSLIRIIEVQRSVISKEGFIERTQNLLTLCPNVEWIFFKGTYEKMGPHRQWLHEQNLSCFFLYL